MIYNFIPESIILDVDDYNSEIKIHSFENILFRTEVCENFYNFHTPIAVKDKKIISISNKQLSFLIHKYKHFIGDNYGLKIKNTYDNLIQNNSYIEIEEPVFLFFDYESVSGTGHAYDLMFYLLYYYITNKLNQKLLVVNSNNEYYNKLLILIKKYYKIEYIYIDINKNYIIKEFKCIRTYQNVFFKEIKEFINNTLIKPIMEYHKNSFYYSIISKIKIVDKNSINPLSISFPITEQYEIFCKKNNIYDLNIINDEEYKIYLLNKAEKIIINWGSIFYVNINYYISDYANKYISLIFDNSMLPQINFIKKINNDYFMQEIPDWATGGYNDQIYKTSIFKGEIISHVNSLDEYISRTKLLSI